MGTPLVESALQGTLLTSTVTSVPCVEEWEKDEHSNGFCGTR